MSLKKSIDKIKNMSAARKRTVANLVDEAVSKKKKPESLAKELKKYAAVKKDQRDWLRVAKTELNDKSSRDALDAIKQIHGDKAKCFRLIGDACHVCRNAFGTKFKPRVWTVDKIPEEYKGAVHPNCQCRPWQFLPAKGS